MHKKMMMSMGLKRCTGSSTETVVEDDDLLTLILLRVPYRKLMSFKSVCKKWLSIITTPHFTRLLSDILPPRRATALLIQIPVIPGSPDVYFVSLDDKNTPAAPFRTLDVVHPKNTPILHSCNGLLLCSPYVLYRNQQSSNGYVYNPSTNQLTTIPKYHFGIYGGVFLYLTFDPSKSIHFKVIALVTHQRGFGIDFFIYSSKTGTWKASVKSFIPPPGMYFFRGGVSWNGCIHWLCTLDSHSEPESSVSDCLYFDVDQERFGSFPRPPIGVRFTSRRSLYFGESEDHLHVIEVCPYATSLDVYEMKSDYSEWFVKYRIDLEPILKVFPHKGIFHDDYAVAVLALIRRDKFQEDSFLVLEIPGKAVRYNLEDRSFKVLWDFSEKHGVWPLGALRVLQYIESLPCVYARRGART